MVLMKKERGMADHNEHALLLAGVERSKMIQLASTSERSNTSGARCAVCGNCTLNATAGGHLFLSVKESRCQPPRIPRTWVIEAGRRGHVVQLTVKRQLAAAVATKPEAVKHELKVIKMVAVDVYFLNTTIFLAIAKL